MKKLFFISVMCSVFSVAAYGQQPLQFGADVAFVGNDGPSGADFDESIRFSGLILFPFSPNASLEGGLSQTTETEDSQTDNTGSYAITLRTGDVFGGIRLQSQPMGKVSLYGRAGLLYYRSEIDFEESFFDIKPAGDITEIEEGTGYYLGAGLAMPLNPNFTLTGEATYRKRNAYFEDASAEFDMDELGVSVGVVFKSL